MIGRDLGIIGAYWEPLCLSKAMYASTRYLHSIFPLHMCMFLPNPPLIIMFHLPMMDNLPHVANLLLGDLKVEMQPY
jgi:hypothetical protein